MNACRHTLAQANPSEQSTAMAGELGLEVVGSVQSMTAGGLVPGTVVLGDVAVVAV